MFAFLHPAFFVALFLVASSAARAADAKPPAPDALLTATDQLWRSGKFAEAEAGYRAILQKDPRLIPAQVGLVRSMLREGKVDNALDSVNAAIVVEPNSAALLAARGDVQFRLGQIPDAETSYLSAKNLDADELHAYLGLVRVYRCESLYWQSHEELQHAHRLAPDDIEVRKAWFIMLPLRERIAAMEAYLSGSHPESEQEVQRMNETLAFLKETADSPGHACRLVSKIEKTETRLDILRNTAGEPNAVGLTAKINDRDADLQFDTGASGILLGRKIAEKAGLTRISAMQIGGIGDKGPQSGYTAVAKHIQIGELVFEDCTVAVSEKGSIQDRDGFIGADVFSHYLVEIDLPGSRLILSPLPKRPEEPVAPAALTSPVEQVLNPEHKTAGDSDKKEGLSHPAQDRYIAPEMSKWTKAYRFGHDLLIPTTVNDSDSLLFGIDTGAFDNILSERTGRQTGSLKSRHAYRVSGFSGNVKKVYSSKVTLKFGHLQQSDIDTVTVDLSNLSRGTGTEISGLLGFAMLQMLDVKLDYRDGLVDLEFDPKRVQHLLKK